MLSPSIRSQINNPKNNITAKALFAQDNEFLLDTFLSDLITFEITENNAYLRDFGMPEAFRYLKKLAKEIFNNRKKKDYVPPDVEDRMDIFFDPPAMNDEGEVIGARKYYAELDVAEQVVRNLRSLVEYYQQGHRFVFIEPGPEVLRVHSISESDGGPSWKKKNENKIKSFTKERYPCDFCRRAANLLGAIRIEDLLIEYSKVKKYIRFKSALNLRLLPYHPYCRCRYRPVSKNLIPASIPKEDFEGPPMTPSDLKNLQDPEMFRKIAQYIPTIIFTSAAVLAIASILGRISKERMLKIVQDLTDTKDKESVLARIYDNLNEREIKRVKPILDDLSDQEIAALVDLIVAAGTESKGMLRLPPQAPYDSKSDPRMAETGASSLISQTPLGSTPSEETPPEPPTANLEVNEDLDRLFLSTLAYNLEQSSSRTSTLGPGFIGGRNYFDSLYDLLKPIGPIEYQNKIYNLAQREDLFNLIRDASERRKLGGPNAKKHLLHNIIASVIDPIPSEFLSDSTKAEIVEKTKVLRSKLQDSRSYRAYTRAANNLKTLTTISESIDETPPVLSLQDRINRIKELYLREDTRTIPPEVQSSVQSLLNDLQSWENVEREINLLSTFEFPFEVVDDLDFYQSHFKHRENDKIQFKLDTILRMKRFLENNPVVDLYYRLIEIEALLYIVQPSLFSKGINPLNPLLERVLSFQRARIRHPLFQKIPPISKLRTYLESVQRTTNYINYYIGLYRNYKNMVKSL